MNKYLKYNHFLPTQINAITNSHSHVFNLNIPQIEKNGDFKLDYRLSSDPVI